MSVGEVSHRAGVGRSTFYEHFRDKDEVLRQALQPILKPLAKAAIGEGELRSVEAALEHIGEHRKQAVAMLKGPTRTQVEQALADLIRERLEGLVPSAGENTRRLECARLAGAQVAVLLAWLMEESTRSSRAEVARVLVEGGFAPRPRSERGPSAPKHG